MALHRHRGATAWSLQKRSWSLQKRWIDMNTPASMNLDERNARGRRARSVRTARLAAVLSR